MKKLFFIKILCSFLLWSSIAITSYSQTKKERQSTLPFDEKYLNYLSENDSILKAKKIIQESIVNSLKKKDYTAAAIGYNVVAMLYEKIGNYEIAREYFKQSLDYVTRDSNYLKISLLQNKLLNTCMLGRFYNYFDSLYPIAQAQAYKLNNENILKNDLLKAKVFYDRDMFDSLYLHTEKTIPIVENANMAEFNFSRDIVYSNFKTSILYQLRLLNACAQINSKSLNLKKQGYQNLLQIKGDSLENYVIRQDHTEHDFLALISMLFYYKGVYYKEKMMYDSATYFFEKSNDTKYESIVDYKKRMAINGNLLYQSAKEEQDIIYENILAEKNKKLFHTYRYIAIASTIILFAFLAYYTLSRKKIKAINNQLIQKNKNLLDYDKERKQFFELVSHELRTPVYGVNGLVTMIDNETDAEKKNNYFSSLRITSQYISMLIDNVLQVSRFSFDERKLNPMPVDIRLQIENIYNSIHVLTKEKKLQLHHSVKLNSENLILLLDRVVLNQIIINLIYNAIKYSDYEKNIYFAVTEVNSTEENIELQFDIRDEGKGINYNGDASEFVPYDQLKNLKHEHSGSGLGLTIVEQLLGYYQSKLFFKSEINKGTHFRFTTCFPVDSKTHTKQVVDSDKKSIINSEKRILIVDDNSLNLLITRKAIEKISPFLKGITADSGTKAIELFKNEKFDLVLMDLNMPDMSGFQATERLKTLNNKTPIIALTALSYNYVIEQATSTGMDDVITKPYTLEEFEKMITNYLN